MENYSVKLKKRIRLGILHFQLQFFILRFTFCIISVFPYDRLHDCVNF